MLVTNRILFSGQDRSDENLFYIREPDVTSFVKLVVSLSVWQVSVEMYVQEPGWP